MSEKRRFDDAFEGEPMRGPPPRVRRTACATNTILSNDTHHEMKAVPQSTPQGRRCDTCTSPDCFMGRGGEARNGSRGRRSCHVSTGSTSILLVCLPPFGRTRNVPCSACSPWVSRGTQNRPYPREPAGPGGDPHYDGMDPMQVSLFFFGCCSVLVLTGAFPFSLSRSRWVRLVYAACAPLP